MYQNTTFVPKVGVKVSVNVKIVNQDLLHGKQILKKWSKVQKELHILISLHNDPQGWCCGSFGLEFSSFIQIDFGKKVIFVIRKI